MLGWVQAFPPQLGSLVGSIGGANLQATQTVQRAMMGDAQAQKAIQSLIAAHPEAASAVQMLIRNAATTQAGAMSLGHAAWSYFPST